MGTGKNVTLVVGAKKIKQHLPPNGTLKQLLAKAGVTLAKGEVIECEGKILAPNSRPKNGAVLVKTTDDHNG